MNTQLTRVLLAGALSSAMVISSGCATTDELAEIRKLAEDARATADGASAAASEAQSTAAEASAKADRAMQTAQQAQACCNANTERMDRMFKRTMMK